ncbi:MAG: DUF1849 family protein [Beijerinckiaceae bacterium]
MRLARLPSLLATAVLAAIVSGAPSRAETVLAPHRATYDFVLGKSVGQKGPSAATGRIVYEVRGDACTGYSINFRQATEVTPPEGEVRSADVRSATFEYPDGKKFRFHSDTFSNGQIVRTVEGTAEKLSGGMAIKMTKPATETVELGIEPLFPVQQTLRTLAAAKAGERVLELKTYDGSDDGKTAFHSLQIIGAPIEKPAGDLTADQASMKGMKRWRVVASSFDLKNTEGSALYALTFEMWENGISSNVIIDYGDFTLVGRMTKLEMFAAKPCSK